MSSDCPTETAHYRGRLAPSPTGYLHVGHARTFATAWRRSRAASGVLVMRMEDLDRERSRTEYADAALEDLRWLGLDWDEGPDVGGAFGPYAQSQRGGLYLKAWRQLRDGGFLYPCRCSRKDLAGVLSAPHESVGHGQEAEEEPIYPGTCRRFWSGEDGGISSGPGEPGGTNWRFRVGEGEGVEFTDERLGSQRFTAGVDFGDFLVWRRDGLPSYQLACVADDHAMGITEVVRGADLLKSTARQILLNRALGFQNPAWFHCDLSLDEHGKRLAKRNDALSIRELRRRGLAPEAVIAWGASY